MLCCHFSLCFTISFRVSLIFHSCITSGMLVWVRSQYAPTQWNRRGGRCSSVVEYSTYYKEKKSKKSPCELLQRRFHFWLGVPKPDPCLRILLDRTMKRSRGTMGAQNWHLVRVTKNVFFPLLQYLSYCTDADKQIWMPCFSLRWQNYLRIMAPCLISSMLLTTGHFCLFIDSILSLNFTVFLSVFRNRNYFLRFRFRCRL